MSTPHPAKIAGLLLGCLLAPGVAAAEIPSAARLILGHPLDAEAGDDESPLAATADDSAPPKSPWTVTLGAGLSYSQTDDVTLGANFNGTVIRDDDDSKWTTSLKYVYNFDENEVKDNFGIISTNYEQMFESNSKLLWFIRGSYQYNQTEAYKTRIKAFAGLGYLVSSTDELKFRVNGGAGGSKDRNGNTAFIPRTTFGYTLDWAINGLTRLTSSTSIENDIGNYADYYLVTEVNLTVKVSETQNLGLYLNIRDEYDSNPSEGDSWNQIWLTMGLSYGF
ncbi:MAG: DUF481 domain-containing protein [Phycisphaerales bacterium]|nr:DUF481 domain-containing protein [Phycisphaerales bacterium]MDG1978938.1 DUF481 domain-containing protein [Phycisphaerales bacterium]MDG2132234.1 DUF481 domain-containing protein [Phycisphaerales bacterium]